jgi:hypothetical protein
VGWDWAAAKAAAAKRVARMRRAGFMVDGGLEIVDSGFEI